MLWLVDLFELETAVAVHEFALHVWAPGPAVATVPLLPAVTRWCPAAHVLQSSWPSVPHKVPAVRPVATVGVPFEHVQVFAVHVWAPGPAVALNLKPAMHALQSSWPSVSHKVPSVVPAASVAVPFEHVQVLAVHDVALDAE